MVKAAKCTIAFSWFILPALGWSSARHTAGQVGLSTLQEDNKQGTIHPQGHWPWQLPLGSVVRVLSLSSLGHGPSCALRPWELVAGTPNDMNVPGQEPSDTINPPERPPRHCHRHGTRTGILRASLARVGQQYRLIPTLLLGQLESVTHGNWYLLLLQGLCGFCQSDLTTVCSSFLSSVIRSGGDACPLSSIHRLLGGSHHTPWLQMRQKPGPRYSLTLAQPVSEPTQHPPSSASLAEELFITGTAGAMAGTQACAMTPQTAPNPALSSQSPLPLTVGRAMELILN